MNITTTERQRNHISDNNGMSKIVIRAQYELANTILADEDQTDEIINDYLNNNRSHRELIKYLNKSELPDSIKVQAIWIIIRKKTTKEQRKKISYENRNKSLDTSNSEKQRQRAIKSNLKPRNKERLSENWKKSVEARWMNIMSTQERDMIRKLFRKWVKLETIHETINRIFFGWENIRSKAMIWKTCLELFPVSQLEKDYIKQHINLWVKAITQDINRIFWGWEPIRNIKSISKIISNIFPLSISEIQKILELKSQWLYWQKIADEINESFHDWKKVRTLWSVKRIFMRRKKQQ